MDDSRSTPVCFDFLPKNLFDSQPADAPSLPTSPCQMDEFTRQIAVPVMKNTRTPEVPIHECPPGLILTTQSGLVFALHDRYIAEHLVLLPIRISVVSCARLWLHRGRNGARHWTDLCGLIQMMSTAYDDYQNAFGAVPSHEYDTPRNSWFDYVLDGVFYEAERERIQQVLKLAESSTKRVCALSPYDSENGDEKNLRSQSTCLQQLVPSCPINCAPAWCTSQISSPSDSSKSTRRSQRLYSPILSSPPMMAVDNGITQLRTMQSPVNILYKTEPCLHYAKFDGYCPTGRKCHFAHGSHELRRPENHPKFRTRICRNFQATGSCPFGDRCFFKHPDNAEQSNFGSLLDEQQRKTAQW